VTTNLDLISPTYIGQDKIGITIDPASLPVLSGGIITLAFDYSDALPEGVVLPLKLIVQPAFGDGTGYFEKTFRRSVPTSYAFTVLGAGRYLAVLKELGHNSWQGRLLIDVAGEKFSQIQSSR
jgi:hypothetical protein